MSGESRQDLINWVNTLLKLNLTKVEQMGTGAAFCQIYDSIYGDMRMERVQFNVNTEKKYEDNFKELQKVFTTHNVPHPVDIPKLVKCKMMENLALLKFTKSHWDKYYPGGEYDAVGRRKGAALTAAGNRGAAGSAARTGTTPTGFRPGARAASGPASTALQKENATLKETVMGLERERDFYFSKLRDIELLIQNAAEEDPEIEKQEDGLVKQIQTILYSTEEGFEIPEEGGELDDQETF